MDNQKQEPGSLLTAEEARKIALMTTEEILNKIRIAAKEHMLSINISGYCSDETKVTLEKLGYTIQYGGKNMSDDTLTISWDGKKTELFI